MTDWQPIQTAPKSGTCILGWWNGRAAVIRYCDVDLCFRHNLISREELGQPTHWMPLPRPPEQTNEQVGFCDD